MKLGPHAGLAVLALLVLVASACSDDDPGPESVPPPASATTKGAAPSAPGPEAGDRAVVGIVGLSGEVVDGEGKRLREGSRLGRGDEVRLAEGARVEIAFDDGAKLAASGPARFRLTELSDTYRTIDLLAGGIERFEVKHAVCGVRTPLDAFVAARDSVVSVQIEESATARRAVFTLLEGGDAKVVDANHLIVLNPGVPQTVTRPQ